MNEAWKRWAFQVLNGAAAFLVVWLLLVPMFDPGTVFDRLSAALDDRPGLWVGILALQFLIFFALARGPISPYFGSALVCGWRVYPGYTVGIIGSAAVWLVTNVQSHTRAYGVGFTLLECTAFLGAGISAAASLLLMRSGEAPVPSDDDPILTEGEDVLGRGPFVEAIVDAITARLTPRTSTSLALAISGRWGEGKTSVWNLVRTRLKSDTTCHVMTIDAWLSGSHELLLRDILKSIQLALRGHARSVYSGRLARKYLATMLGKWSAPLSPDSKSHSDLRDELSAELDRAGTRIVVCIDNLDRLTSAEVIQVLRVVRSVLDMNNLLFLLCYDYRSIQAALAAENVSRDFLEKIVQLDFRLPVPPDSKLERKCDKLIEELVEGLDLSEDARRFFSRDWRALDGAVIKPYLVTMRDVKRFIIAVEPTLRRLGSELNVRDYLLLQLLQMKSVAVYDAVVENSGLFIGGGLYDLLTGPGKSDSERLEDRRTTVLRLVGEDTDAIGILRLLFPRIDAAFRKASVSRGYIESDRELQRICDESCFPRYFEKQLRSDDVGDAELDVLVEYARTDTKKLSKAVATIVEQHRLFGLVRSLDERSLGLSDDAWGSIARAVGKDTSQLRRRANLFLGDEFDALLRVLSRIRDSIEEVAWQMLRVELLEGAADLHLVVGLLCDSRLSARDESLEAEHGIAIKRLEKRYIKEPELLFLDSEDSVWWQRVLYRWAEWSLELNEIRKSLTGLLAAGSRHEPTFLLGMIRHDTNAFDVELAGKFVELDCLRRIVDTAEPSEENQRLYELVQEALRDEAEE